MREETKFGSKFAEGCDIDFHERVQSRLTCDPVNGDALNPADTISDDIFSPRLVSLGPAYGAQAHVDPIDCVIVCQEKASASW